jgi:hypothetical protein
VLQLVEPDHNQPEPQSQPGLKGQKIQCGNAACLKSPFRVNVHSKLFFYGLLAYFVATLKALVVICTELLQ